jgi:hypothetical protein
MPDNFDRLLDQFKGLPDVVRTDQKVTRFMPPMGVGGSETFIVQTIRQRGLAEDAAKTAKDARSKEWLFVEHITKDRTVRLVFPPEVCDVIARQRDSLTTKNRKRGARQALETKREKGLRIGNPEALRKARKARGRKAAK